MAPILYSNENCPAGRAVEIIAEVIGLKLDVKYLDLYKGENRTPEFLKLNPQHTVPTLQDEDGFVVWDSHPIITYLIGKYAKDDTLYPNDLKTRAVIDQRHHFETGVIFPRFIKRSIYIIENKTLEATDEIIKEFHEIYDFLEAFLDGKKWIAGDSVTAADYTLIPYVTAANLTIPLDTEKWQKLSAWLENAKKLKGAEINQKGIEHIINSFLKPFGYKN